MTGTVTLVEFLRARLDEDETVARACRYQSWMLDGSDVVGGQTLETIVDWVYADADREHIPRHDPARVLADVEAKRRIIDQHHVTVKRADAYPFNPMTGEPQGDTYDVECEICDWVSDDPTSACLTIRLLALPFATHPDYREEWKP